jgi:hypothetical protein
MFTVESSYHPPCFHADAPQAPFASAVMSDEIAAGNFIQMN